MKTPGNNNWYTDAADYWASVDSTVNGMLGGFEQVSEPDCRDSLKFIQSFIAAPDAPVAPAAKGPPTITPGLACDCGAGIGRVSKHFLLRVFDRVDLVEQNAQFLETARTSYMGQDLQRVEQFIPIGLQDFTPEHQRYDLIWCQWVLGHLTDEDLVKFFKRCKDGIKPGGLIGVKENVTKGGVIVDDEDSSVTRSDYILKQIFEQAGLKLLKEATQTDFPAGLFTVKMYMLKPIQS
ncbi:alpha-N-methyltransferase NTM1 [Polychytrium aggregatum]|uniref:alpha-N-methyltransferase NTM1 n=1 Tax=Polychytrium aggregatum TaxID=110093 RepID=UPI0022FE54DD|nr:alpha-N-methyltransferase NTM1 [Polychytrium aggregatum]KAI9208852.1 alpha-N-methyltransferase NTM1 [Polychytrium aggregatum]